MLYSIECLLDLLICSCRVRVRVRVRIVVDVSMMAARLIGFTVKSAAPMSSNVPNLTTVCVCVCLQVMVAKHCGMKVLGLSIVTNKVSKPCHSGGGKGGMYVCVSMVYLFIWHLIGSI